MNCPRCRRPLEHTYRCPYCGYVDDVLKKIIYASNWHYNQGLEKAKVRDLSGAMNSLKMSLKYDKQNIDARNLLGLVYYQMGELVHALSEWIISVNFRSSNNRAKFYIKRVKENPGKLDAANRTIRKYNQALLFLEEGNADLAIIELKKVVNLNPNYIRAYQLLGLLYFQRQQYAAAKKILVRAVHLDRNNMTTLYYLEELSRFYGSKPGRYANGSNNGFTPITDPNPVVIDNPQISDVTQFNTSMLTFVNVLIGIVIGVAVVWLLLVPSVKKSKTEEYNQAITQYSSQINEKNKQITALQNQVDKLESSGGITGTAETAASDENTDALMAAMTSYANNDLVSVGYAVAEVDPDTLSDSAKTLYETLLTKSKDYVFDYLYSDAVSLYQQKDYLKAIEEFEQVLRFDSGYANAIFYIGDSYRKLGDPTAAKTYYSQIVNEYKDNEHYNEASNYLADIQAREDAVQE